MEKAFEDIVERLEERMDRPYRRISIQTVIEIVNQVAEEYKHVTTCYLQSPCEYQNEDVRIPEEEVCEWKKRKDRRYFPYKSSCGYRDLMNDDYVYCPYCGKKIKVVE